jgi:hypothetical protein
VFRDVKRASGLPGLLFAKSMVAVSVSIIRNLSPLLMMRRVFFFLYLTLAIVLSALKVSSRKQYDNDLLSQFLNSYLT